MGIQIEFILDQTQKEALKSLGSGTITSYGEKWTNLKTGMSLKPYKNGWINDTTKEFFPIQSKLGSNLKSNLKKTEARTKDLIFDAKIL